MRTDRLAGIVESSKEFTEAATQLEILLNDFADKEGTTFDVSKQIRGRDSTTAQLLSRLKVTGELVHSFGKSTRSELVPLKLLSALEQSIKDLMTALGELISAIQSVEKSHRGLSVFDYSNFTATCSDGNSVNLQSQFNAVFDHTESLLEAVSQSIHLLKPRGAVSFQASASALSEVLEANSEKAAKLNLELSKLKSEHIELQQNQQKLSGESDQLASLTSQAQTDRKAIGEYAAASSTQAAEIKATHEKASALERNVNAYAENFQQFEKQLADREARLASGKKFHDELVAELEKQRQTIKGLVADSEAMLASSTNSALASNFNDIKKSLTKELWWARVSFYVSIFILFISAIPLVGFVILPLISPFIPEFSEQAIENMLRYSPGNADSSWQYLGQVLARATILLPAAWLVSFAAIRHSSLFRLREHYAFKYSMAVSVEGFKKQSPEYEQEIAAMILEILAFNPADKLVPSRQIKEGKAPVLAAALFETFRSRLSPKDEKEK